MQMKIIFLNTWHGRLREPFLAYLQEHLQDTDIFCFQEAYDSMLTLSRDVLKGYEEMVARKNVTDDVNEVCPQAIYVKRGLPVLSSGTIFETQKGYGLGLYVEVGYNNKSVSVCNFYGLSRPVDKLDDPNRVLQSEALIEFFKGKNPAIIGGDFNLLPNTKSIELFEEHGYKDLIKEFKIVTTRNEFAWELYPDNKQYHSDYVFVSPDCTVKKFSVPNDKISDHLPLEVEVTP